MQRYLWHSLFWFAVLLGSCAKRPVAQAPPPAPQSQNLVVLLADEQGQTGRIAVSNAGVNVEVGEAEFAVRLPGQGTPPTAPFRLGQVEIQRIWGAELAGLPPEELSFALYFDLNSLNLVAESRESLPRIVAAILARQSTDISVIGHTDTTGDSRLNYTFGLERAQAVRELLRSFSINQDDVYVSSHGDKDLLIPTPPGTNEPRNRRVEVIVR